MSDHEFWNELGNLYYMSGNYEPAIHAYARAITANRKFGRSYSNMALAFTQTGKYTEAIELYHRGIELLADEKEKAVTWNRLGILYRQLKDYHSAVVAYQKADDLDCTQDQEREDVARRPITVSMPEIDLQSILMEDQGAFDVGEEKIVDEINTEFVFAEDSLDEDQLSASELTLQWFDEEGFVPPNPEVDSVLGAFPAADEDSAESEVTPLTYGEWKPAQIETETLALEDFAMSNHQDNSRVFESVTDSIQSFVLESVEVPIPALMNVTEPEAVQYSQVEYPLVETSEFETLKTDIEKFKSATEKNPKSTIAWEELGDVYKKAGRFTDSIRAYERAINEGSNKPSLYYRLGLVFAAERLESQAIKSFQKTLELDNTYTLAHASLGSHYRKVGLHDLAQKHIDIAMSSVLDDENEYNRACLEAICGNNDRALELLQTALQAKQTDISWVKIDPDLDSLREDTRYETLLSAYVVSK